MSGHSKWATIKHKKGKTDARRGKLFSKLARAIIVAAQEGGADPTMNISLADAIEKAKRRSHAQRQHRARHRARRGGNEGEQLREHPLRGLRPRAASPSSSRCSPTTEPFGRRRAQHLQQARRQPGAPGAVAWVFERRGSIMVDAGRFGEDDVMAAAIEGGADDVSSDGDEFEVLTRARRPGAGARGARGGRHRVRAAPSSP